MEKSFKKKVSMCDMLIRDQTTDNQNSYQPCITHDICKTDEKQENNGLLHPIVEWQKYNEDILNRSIQGHHHSNV